MEGYFFRINKNLFSFTFINDITESHDWKDSNKWSHYPLMHRLLNFMKDRDFNITHDEHVSKIIRKDFWYGRKGELEFVAHRYPRGFSLEFFQDVNFENPNGGRYDFDKFEKAPYLIKLLWINETKKMGQFLESLGLGIINNSDVEVKSSEDKIIQFWNKYSFDKHPVGFKLSDMIGHDNEPSYNNADRNGKTILNGQTKYFRNYDGRLARGKVYHNINNMWWVIINDSDYDNIADFALFDPTEEDFKIRRKVKDRKPKEYLDKIKNIQKLSNKDLLKELKNRGLKVS